MATNDISRSSTDFRKHYKEVWAQQGRVFVDDDHNENERLHGEADRRALVDVIGAAGSPGDGFLISGLQVTGGKIDFNINPGTFYLGGLHLEMDQIERFQTQYDFLQSSRAPVAIPSGARFDLIYLEAWLQPVSAVEDTELFEVALGGPDTSTRMRLMRRVHIAPGVTGNNCRDAWQSLRAIKQAAKLGTINEENELVPDTKLTVDFVQGTNPADLCSPPVGGGYLGAENQAIRVQLTDATHLTWGFDNAAPLYRVKVSTDSAGQKRVITMLNDFRDQAHWALSGQTVELLAWSAVLPNKEKLAETGGFLTSVHASYDPDTKQFTINDDVPSLPVPFGEDWKARSDASQLVLGATEFFYMRVWSRGSDTTPTPQIAFVTGTAVNLGQTGLKITITGNDRQPGDHWIIAARPESPNQVVPWLLEDGRAPHGYRRFYAPLGLIEWTVTTNPSGVSGTVHDCRETFRPLTERRGSCCTYTVGDGKQSHGDFTSIQTAIDKLPASGGEICVLPGLYEENVLIQKRHKVKIKGCGWRSRVKSKPPAAGGRSGPVFHIDKSQHICLEALQIEADPTGVGVQLTGPDLIAANGGILQSDLLRNITLERLRIFAHTSSAIDLHTGFFVTIHDCHVAMFDVTGTAPAVSIFGDDMLIEGNVIQVISLGQLNAPAQGSPTDEIDWTYTATAGTGGLYVGGGCDRVRVINNLIFNGIGDGITLGSVDTIISSPPSALNTAQDQVARNFSSWHTLLPDPCQPRPVLIQFEAPTATGSIQHVAGPPLSDILIERNRIFRMGGNGIGVDAFFDLNTLCEMISVSGLTIIGNEIRHCLNRAPAAINPGMIEFQGYGGIALAAVSGLVIRDNVIEDNGPDHLKPICGIFVLRGNGIDIGRNRIFNNGARNNLPSAQAEPGPRGGIYIAYAIAPRKIVTVPVNPFQTARSLSQIVSPVTTVAFSLGLPAVKIYNNIVCVPLGRALVITAVGPVSVTDNHFTSLGAVRASAANRFEAATVDIQNLGVSSENWHQPTGYALLRQAVPPPASTFIGDDLVLPGPIVAPLGQYLGNGNVLFCDNLCELNLLEVPEPAATLSIRIISLDDIGFHQNQCDCDLVSGNLPMQVYLHAFTVRATGNRFKEPVGHAALSASTFGYLNTTTNNQSTHCLLIAGTHVIKLPNQILEGFYDFSCALRTANLQTGFFSQRQQA